MPLDVILSERETTPPDDLLTLADAIKTEGLYRMVVDGTDEPSTHLIVFKPTAQDTVVFAADTTGGCYGLKELKTGYGHWTYRPTPAGTEVSVSFKVS